MIELLSGSIGFPKSIALVSSPACSQTTSRSMGKLSTHLSSSSLVKSRQSLVVPKHHGLGNSAVRPQSAAARSLLQAYHAARVA